MNFFNELESSKQKKKYQTFVVELGIEKFKVAIPFERTELFEKCVSGKKPKTKKKLQEILDEVEGQFMELMNE